MDSAYVAAGPSDAAWVADQRKWARGWRRVLFPGIFLAWLIQVATAIPPSVRSTGWRVVGFSVLGVFCATYVAVLYVAWRATPRLHLALLGVLSALVLAELPLAHADALIMGVFVCAAALIRFPAVGFVLTLFFTGLAIFLPPLVTAWHQGIATGLDNGTAIAIPLTGLAMYGFGRVVNSNALLVEARTELARLAAEGERTRIARDLHDLLGHSLSAISVKSELAERLAAHDPSAAAREIREVAELSRRALGDVRAAVANFHDVTLAGELATGHEILRAAGIEGDLPRSVEVVDEATQELFGWVVREGLTNVVRHSHARHCRVRVDAQSVEITDDGASGGATYGHGLSGLAVRVASAGGRLEAGPDGSGGWRLAVTLGTPT